MWSSDITTALKAVVPNTSRYKAVNKTDQYIVWAEDGQGAALHADNKAVGRTVAGTVDYFTKAQDDPTLEQIEAAMDGIGMAWRWESTQYEEETGYIHHEWSWQVVA